MAYFGTLFGKMSAVVVLLAAASHTAVWLGASTPNARYWIQGGLEGSATRYAYVEVGRAGHQVSLRRWPVSPDHHAFVRLHRRGDRWQVAIDGYRSRWWRLPHAVTITTLETNGPAVALIDGNLVQGA